MASLTAGLDLGGTPVAVFGLGDSVSYADNFAGMQGFDINIYRCMQGFGAELPLLLTGTAA